MRNRAYSSSDLTTLPLLAHESLYIGIDIAKARHVAGFVSTTLLERHERFEACPALVFANSREGFRALIERVRTLAPLEQCFVVMERTGHYHRALQQYLQEPDLPVYLMHVQARSTDLLKTDKRDALSLANQLYNQLELGVQVSDKLQLIRRAVPPTEAAAQLKGLIRHRYELIRESTQRKNKLTALCDELFPELTQVLKDPNSPTALALRERFPTPYALATASLGALQDCRGGAHCLSDAKLVQLQRLAAQSIGIKDLHRQRSLTLEQHQLIAELRLLQAHARELEQEIVTLVEQAREGQILMSFPGVGPVMAASIIAAIGHINNFSKAAELKKYFGWAPVRKQTGTSYDYAHLTQGGTRTMKQMMFLIVFQAIRSQNNEWARLYERLVKTRCPYDERTQAYVGKRRIIGRVAGQMIEAMYALLKQDAEVLSHVPADQDPPPPLLYDPEVHRRHRQGEYRPLKSMQPPGRLTLLHALPSE